MLNKIKNFATGVGTAVKAHPVKTIATVAATIGGIVVGGMAVNNLGGKPEDYTDVMVDTVLETAEAVSE